jgi:hypothetical protein
MKAQTLTVEEFATPAPPPRGDTAVGMLNEGAARLQTAEDQPGQPDYDIIFKPAPAAPTVPSFVKEAVALVVLTFLFTAVFWVVLSYMRSH